MDRLSAMTIFVTAVDEGSLSAAGRKLGLPLATVSRKLSELEAHLGARLLRRSTRMLDLTDAGEAFLTASRRILDDIHDAERAAAGEYNAPRGELVITAPVVFGRLHVLPLIADFLREHSEVDVRLVLGDRTLNLLDEHLDVAVRIGPLPDSALVAIRVGEVRRVVCANPDYLESQGVPRRPEDLATHHVVTFDALRAPSPWTFRDERGDHEIPVRARLTVNTANAAIDAAIAGVGLTRVLSYQVDAAVQEGRLRVVLRDHEPPPLPVHLVYPRQGRMPLKLRAFLDAVAPRLRERLAAT